MKRLITALLILTTALSSLNAQNLLEQSAPKTLVNDYAGVMTAAQVTNMEAKLVDFDLRTSTQIAVVTTNDIGAMDPSDFAQRLHEKWGVGRSGRDNGVLILVVPQDRKTYISVGYGLEGAIPDITAGRIIDQEMLVSFRANDYYTGIDNAINVLMKLSEGEFTADQYSSGGQKSRAGIIPMVILIIFLVIMMIISTKGKNNSDNNDSNGGGGRWIPPFIIGSMLGRGGRSSGGGFGGFGGGGFGGFGGGGSGGGGAGRSWIVLAVLSLFMTSCNKSNVEKTADRTVIVYMAADNNISSLIRANIDQMVEGMKNVGNKSNLIVYFDGATTPPQLMKIDNKGMHVIETYEEENSASPQTIKRVITTIQTKYPAKSYGLVLSSHGMGWLKGGTSVRAFKSVDQFIIDAENRQSMWYRDSSLPATKWFGQDKSNYLEIEQLSAALAGFAKFDFILFDACFMSGIEVLYELRNTSHYIISSAAEVMGDGFPYNLICSQMLSPTLDLKMICNTFVDYYEGRSYPSATISLVKTSELSTMATTVSPIFGNHGDVTLNFNNIQHYEKLATHVFYDFDNYIKQLSASRPELYEQFVVQRNKTIVFARSTPKVYSVYNGGGFFVVDPEKFSGISTYIPRINLPYNDSYFETSWATAVGISAVN